MVMPVVIGDAGSLGRDIAPTDYALGWKVTGLPGAAVSLDTWQTLLESRLRAILTAIITADAPTGLTLSNLSFTGPTTIQLDYMVGGHASQLTVDLAALFPTTGLPSPLGLTGALGSLASMPHADHGHGLPSRAAGDTPIIGIDHLANAPGGGFGMRLGFNASTGAPEFVPENMGVGLSLNTPQPVGLASAPVVGMDPAASHADHGHELAARSVGIAELAAAPNASAYGMYLGFDPTTGEPAVLSAGGGTFLSQSDTPAAYGTTGMVPEINTVGDALVFGGPYQPLTAPIPPTQVRVTDAFDGFLEYTWAADPDAASYEYQRKATSAPWPPGDGTPLTTTSIRNGTPLALTAYDFRVRAVSTGGHLRSSWIELLNVPVIATPTPGTSLTHSLVRVRSRTLSFSWDDLDVDNGGAGQTRVVKQTRYEYQYREEGLTVWGAAVEHTDHTGHEIDSLTNGTMYEARVRGVVRRSDGSMSEINGAYSGASNPEKPVKTTVTLTYGVAATRTGMITAPRTLELTPGAGSQIEITNTMNPVLAGEFYALDIDRGEQYARNYNIVVLETRPLPSDITMGADYMAEAEPTPGTGPRRYSVGPAVATSSTQPWLIEVN